MLARLKCIILAVALLMCLSQVAYAGLAAVGPNDPNNGFPIWYKDSLGRMLELCLDGDGVNGPCLFDPVDPNNPFSVQTGFGAEAFWMLASATFKNPTMRAVLVLGLEAAYNTGDPADGEQITFGRVRIRVTGLPADGIYTIVHPYGRQEFNVVADPLNPRDINYIQDIGIGAPGDFSGALSSSIGPFLRWTAPDYPYIDPVTGNQYVGNPQVNHLVTGSPFGTNYFQIIAPPGVVINPATGGNVITVRAFSLMGKLSTRFGVGVDRAVYSRDTLGGGFVDVFATSGPGQQINVSGIGAAPILMQEVPTAGQYRARIPFDGITTLLPSSITVTNVTDIPDTAVVAKVTDIVSITNAIFGTGARSLLISAQSSDLATLPALTGAGYRLGTLAPPNSVTVDSAAGGSDTEPVTAVGARLP